MIRLNTIYGILCSTLAVQHFDWYNIYVSRVRKYYASKTFMSPAGHSSITDLCLSVIGSSNSDANGC